MSPLRKWNALIPCDQFSEDDVADDVLSSSSDEFEEFLVEFNLRPTEKRAKITRN